MALGCDCTADRSDKWLCGRRLRYEGRRALLACLEAQDSHGCQEQAWVSLLLLPMRTGHPKYVGDITG